MTDEKPIINQKINDKWSKLILVAFVAGMAVLLVYLFINWSQITKAPLPFQPTTKTTTESKPFTAKVELTSKGFIPKTLLINKGSTVAVVNKDKKPHLIYPDPHPIHQSEVKITEAEVLPEALLTITFDTAGKYVLHTEDSPLKTKLTIIVQ